jgi:hypothetical protein
MPIPYSPFSLVAFFVNFDACRELLIKEILDKK